MKEIMLFVLKETKRNSRRKHTKNIQTKSEFFIVNLNTEEMHLVIRLFEHMEMN